jgi:hypothetical protein
MWGPQDVCNPTWAKPRAEFLAKGCTKAVIQFLTRLDEWGEARKRFTLLLVARRQFTLNSAEWRNNYLQNRDTVVNYLEMMEERQELGKDTAVRAGVNAMVRLVRDFGCSRERYFDAVKGGYDWESAQDADRVLCAALKAGCNLGELVSEVVVNGKVELARVEMVNRDFAATKAKLCYCEVGCGGAALRLGINAERHLRSRRPLLDGHSLPQPDASIGSEGRPGCSPEQCESALESMERQPISTPIDMTGETLPEAEVARVKAGRHSRAIGVFKEFDEWEETMFLSVCNICRWFVLQDRKVGQCPSIREHLVVNKSDQMSKCTDCATARRNARAFHAKAWYGGPIEPALLDPWGPVNGMCPSSIPDVLKELIVVETLMTSLIAPMMKIKILRAGTRALSGNGIAFRQPVENLFTFCMARR